MRPDDAGICPIILAVDPNGGFPRALARFGGRTALQIALDNCSGLRPAIVVADRRTLQCIKGQDRAFQGIRRAVRGSVRGGQIGSIFKALKLVPETAAFMLYPVDYPLLTPAIVQRLVQGFETRLPRQQIAAPVFRARSGHPVIFAPEMRGELMKATTARDVVYRVPSRVKWVGMRTGSIYRDFDSEAAYRRLLREYLRKR